jgi:hypothetical protein
MTSCRELVTICQNLTAQIENGPENFTTIANLISRRADLEMRFSAMLKEIIPPMEERTDRLTTSFLEELGNEVTQHANFAALLKSKIVNPMNNCIVTQKEKQRNINAMIKKELEGAKKISRQIEAAQKEIDILTERVNQAPQKADSFRHKLQRANLELQQQVQNEMKVTTKAQAQSIPIIHQQFSDFEAGRLLKEQQTIVAFENLRMKHHEAIDAEAIRLKTRVMNVDAADVSKRYVSKLFDPNTTSLKEEDEPTFVIAIADYHSTEPRDLQFRRGEEIKVTVQHKSGWWEGELNGKVGVFPRSFVMKPGDQDTSDKIGAVFLVIKDHVPERAGELKLLAGDLVYVDYVQKGRCSGTNLRDKKRGYFPLETLERRM